ncbi:MAG: methyltransferase domain-containing protein [Pseudomonadota bacterium]
MDDETVAVYNKRASDYFTRFTSPKPGTALINFIKHLPGSGKVLDLGCGPGNSSRHLIDEGYEVEAIDASEEMVRIANEACGVNARLATFDEIDTSAGYVGVWANFALLHAPRSDFPRHIASIAKSLSPGGIFHIGMKTGKGEKRDDIGRRYSYFEVGELEDELVRAGFAILDVQTGEEAGLDGIVAPWAILLAEKPSLSE